MSDSEQNVSPKEDNPAKVGFLKRLALDDIIEYCDSAKENATNTLKEAKTIDQIKWFMSDIWKTEEINEKITKLDDMI